MPLQKITFQEALTATAEKKRNLILGNGFSVSLHSGFSYWRLYDEAARLRPEIAPLFAGHGVDFERAMAAATEPAHRTAIRDALLQAISKVHPRGKFLTPEASAACAAFLKDFAGVERAGLKGRVFTTNYDFLLYWVLVQQNSMLKIYDGFDQDAVWSAGRVWNSHIAFLHGALHLYQGSFGPKKEQRKLISRPERRLIYQVRDNLDLGIVPTFISEGTAAEKVQRINRDGYLKKMRRTLIGDCSEPGTAVFTVGHSLGVVDEHITNAIGLGAAEVYLGVFSEPDEARAQEVAEDWTRLRTEQGLGPLVVHTFPTKPLAIWKQA